MGLAASTERRMSETDFESYQGRRYTQEVPDSRDTTHGPTYFTGHRSVNESVQTLYHAFLRGWSVEDGARPCYGTRVVDAASGRAGEYVRLTYAEVKQRADAISSGLTALTKLPRQSCVGIFSKNRLEWCLAMHASDRMAYVLVPLYDTLGPDAVPFVLNHTELSVLFCAREQLRVVLACAPQCPCLRLIVQFEPVTSEQRLEAQELGLELRSLDDVELLGRADPLPADPPRPSDVSTLCYTSGTTGEPKGVVITHRSLAQSCELASARLGTTEDDVHLSYLPLPHVFERSIIAALMSSGGAVGFYRGDVLLLLEDLAALRPTAFVSVPRLFNRVFDKVTQSVAATGGLPKLLFDCAYAAKRAGAAQMRKQHAVWDALVFAKTRRLLGGRVRIIVSGSAPLAAEVKEFMQIAFCCDVVEGYGLSETSAALTLSTPGMRVGSHVGPPIDNALVRLEDVPEMGYSSADKPRPRGEVLAKGPNLFAGYYKAEDATCDAIDADGWFHTGDIGCWNADGTLSIIDRKKNIFKLAQGEYVAAEKVERAYLKSRFVAQVFVHGDSLQSCLVAVVVPDLEVAEAWAAERGLPRDHATVARLVNDSKAFREDVERDMARAAEAAGLRGFERVRKVHLHPDAFSMEAGLLTPTFKLRRQQLKELFLPHIRRMYAELK